MFFLNSNEIGIREFKDFLKKSENNLILENLEIIMESFNTHKNLILNEEEVIIIKKKVDTYVKDVKDYTDYLNDIEDVDKLHAELEKSKFWNYILLGTMLLGIIIGAFPTLVTIIIGSILMLIALIGVVIRAYKDDKASARMKTKLLSTRAKLVAIRDKVKDPAAKRKIDDAIGKIDDIENHYQWDVQKTQNTNYNYGYSYNHHSHRSY